MWLNIWLNYVWYVLGFINWLINWDILFFGIVSFLLLISFWLLLRSFSVLVLVLILIIHLVCWLLAFKIWRSDRKVFFRMWMQTFHEVVHQVDISEFRLFLVTLFLPLFWVFDSNIRACLFHRLGGCGLCLVHLSLLFRFYFLFRLRLWRIISRNISLLLLRYLLVLVSGFLLFVVLVACSTFCPWGGGLLSLLFLRILRCSWLSIRCLINIIICFKMDPKAFSLMIELFPLDLGGSNLWCCCRSCIICVVVMWILSRIIILECTFGRNIFSIRRRRD